MSEKLLAAGSVTLMAAGSLLGATAANAATAADCGTHPGATVTLINGTICEVIFDTVGEHTFTAPAGVTAFEAILIGGGAGSFQEFYDAGDASNRDDFAGYSGSASWYEYEDVSAPLDVYVGDGGTYERIDWNDGAPVITTDGESGEDTDLGENSATGTGIPLEEDFEFPGFAVSETWLVGEDNPLFPPIDGEPLYSRFGSVEANAADCLPTSYGSGGDVCGTTFNDGSSGAVIIRWALPADLAATGVDASAIGIGAGALLAGGVALGAVAAVRRARVKN